MKKKIDNQNLYNKSRLKIFLSNLIPSVLCLFARRNRNLIVLNGFLNTSFSDNTKYLFLYLIKNSDKEIKYVINDDSKRDQLTHLYGDYFIETNSFKGKLYALSASIWFVNAFEFPVGGLFLKFRRNVIHLTHGAPIKNAGLCEKQVSFLKRMYYKILQSDVSYSLATAEVFKKYIANHIGISPKSVIINGFPRFDPLYKGDYIKLPENNDKTRILYAPTWRHFSEVKLFPFEDYDFPSLEYFLKEIGIIIYLRMHPDFEASIPDCFVHSKQFYIFSGKQFPDINDYMGNFDMLITDYSSIFYDFMVFDRPMFFFDYDVKEYERHIGFAVDYENFAVGYRPKTQKQFIADLEDAKKNDSYKTKRNEIKKLTIGDSKSNCGDLIQRLREMKIYR